MFKLTDFNISWKNNYCLVLNLIAEKHLKELGQEQQKAGEVNAPKDESF